MSQRGDFNVLVEPFEPAAYYSAQRVVKRYDISKPEYNYDKIFGSIVQLSQQSPLFIKNHAYYITHLAKPVFLDSFLHSFIIRHPRDALPSRHDKWPDQTLQETGYLERAELFDAVVRHTGRTPAVVDADDLVENPQGIVKAYCQHIGIEFRPEALQWEPIKREVGMWHQQLAKTSGFVAIKNDSYVSVTDHPRLRLLYEACLPPYERLYKHRLCAV